MEPDARSIAVAWLAEMQASVRAVDFARCRAIFAADIVGFGTHIDAAVGLEALERDQWRHIWGRIQHFTFALDQLHCAVSGAGLWLACPWSSESRGADGAWHARPGRITAVLEKRDERWLAVHTHHSVAPDPTAGPRA